MSEELPTWKAALAVVARPDDEAVALGGVLEALARTGTRVTILSLSHGSGRPDETAAKRQELESAGALLGVARTLVLELDESTLSTESPATLADGVAEVVRRTGAEGLVALDFSAVPNHSEATTAALSAAERLDLPLLAWTLPTAVADQLNAELGTGYQGVDDAEIDLVVSVDRDRQRVAGLAQAEQPVLVRRVELLGPHEHLRWLRVSGEAEPEWTPQFPSATTEAPVTLRVIRAPEPLPEDEPETVPEPVVREPEPEPVPMRRRARAPEGVLVEQDEGETFRVSVRGFDFVVDPGGPDGEGEEGPTPHELFVAGLASCVGWYARRYLRRQRLDPAGLAVETTFRLNDQQTHLIGVELRLHVPAALTPRQQERLVAFAGRCSTYQAFTDPPDLSISLA